jgi:hypothetical protein
MWCGQGLSWLRIAGMRDLLRQIPEFKAEAAIKKAQP